MTEPMFHPGSVMRSLACPAGDHRAARRARRALRPPGRRGAVLRDLPPAAMPPRERCSGAPDMGQLGMRDYADHYGRIAAAAGARSRSWSTPTPASEACTTWRRWCVNFERSGAAGLFIEDQVTPKRCGYLAGKAVVPVADQLAKLRAALDTRRDEAFRAVRPHRRLGRGRDRGRDRSRGPVSRDRRGHGVRAGRRHGREPRPGMPGRSPGCTWPTCRRPPPVRR